MAAIMSTDLSITVTAAVPSAEPDRWGGGGERRECGVVWGGRWLVSAGTDPPKRMHDTQSC